VVIDISVGVSQCSGSDAQKYNYSGLAFIYNDEKINTLTGKENMELIVSPRVN
jgi:hypothetical protein